jgi:hypothetical protein
VNGCGWHIAAQSQCSGMSAAGESGLCIVSHRLASWTRWVITSAAIARGEPVHRSASALPQAVVGVPEKIERASRAAT